MIFENIAIVARQQETHNRVQTACSTMLVADDIPDAIDIIGTSDPDLVIFDNTFKPEDIEDFLNHPNINLKNKPVVFVNRNNDYGYTAEHYNNIPIAGCICTDQVTDIPSALANLVGNNNNDVQLDYFANELAANARIVGKSKAMLHTLRMTETVARSNCNPVLVIGKTGTGKEGIAKAVHDIRHNNDNFIAVNCAALTATLLESELFGHLKGAFTGADKNKIGLFEAAQGGTLFLDEISEMSLDLQAKLLRVLQEKKFRRVGDTKDILCTATIVASSNRNLKIEIQNNRFRQDLYYRLNICPIIIAPLSSPSRKDDIKLLAQYFLETSTICPDRTPASFTKLALNSLSDHDWPGNVRELQNTIDRSILIETTDKIGLSSIIFDPDIDDDYTDTDQKQSLGKLKDMSLVNAEKELIAKALNQTNWQKTKAAKALGITRATLYSKVKQYDIKQNSSAESEPAMA